MVKIIKELLCVVIAFSFSTMIFASTSDQDWVLIKKGKATLQSDKFAVNYDYRIMKYEVTVKEYCDFLNAIAEIDTYNLYDKKMSIERSDKKPLYIPEQGKEKHPITYINFSRAARYANWIHNSKPKGVQDEITTEQGSYDMKRELFRLTHNKNAKVWIPTEKEWCKAAYYSPKKSSRKKQEYYWDFGDMTLYKTDKYPIAEKPSGSKHSANYNKKLQGTTKVGAYKKARSEYGLYDMNGNVFEWTETEMTSGTKNIRGGAWNSTDSYVFIKTRTIARVDEVSSGYGVRLAGRVE